MSVIRRTSLPSVRPILEDLPERLRQMFDGTLTFEPLAEPIGWLPAMEIVEKDDALIVTAELPGVSLNDVNITVEEGLLSISGEKKEEKEMGKVESRYHVWERRYGSFKRSFTLPQAVDTSKIAADFANGILTVTLPKSEKAKEHGRKIPIGVKK